MAEDGIFVFDEPQEVDAGKWAKEHLDCDTIIDDLRTTPELVVYAYAKTKAANRTLEAFRDQNYPEKHILCGLPHEALYSIAPVIS